MAEKRDSNDPLSLKVRIIGWLAAMLIRLFCLTYRWDVVDHAGVKTGLPDRSLIWAFWHNSVFALPGAYERYFSSRTGAVLTSASKDGALIASVMKSYGIASVRGSSSRRGASALLGLTDWIKRGHDVVITPDGPRGPRYRLAPGMIKLAQVTGAGIVLIRVESSSFWQFNSWDRFKVPKPFSKLRVIFEAIQTIEPELEDEAFEAERARIESVLNANNETD